MITTARHCCKWGALTAAHCVNSEPDGGIIYVRGAEHDAEELIQEGKFKTRGIAPRAVAHLAADIVKAASSGNSSSTGVNQDRRDMAILFFDGAVNTSYAEISTDTPKPGEPTLLVGYGDPVFEGFSFHEEYARRFGYNIVQAAYGGIIWIVGNAQGNNALILSLFQRLFSVALNFHKQSTDTYFIPW